MLYLNTYTINTVYYTQYMIHEKQNGEENEEEKSK